MAVTVELSEETLSRLRAEAARRGLSIDDVIAELVAQLPARKPGGQLSFAGVGSSGTTKAIGRRHREIITEEHEHKKASDM
ncbi:MAG TPA: hypothetical protein VE569_07660 [Acidimicrobiia bacterium]|nr:hypothetical protein [Acidimicrobiia bacterium]